jgi:hypothetical protein
MKTRLYTILATVAIGSMVSFGKDQVIEPPTSPPYQYGDLGDITYTREERAVMEVGRGVSSLDSWRDELIEDATDMYLSRHFGDLYPVREKEE